MNSSSTVTPDNPKLVLESVDMDSVIEIPETTQHQLIFYDPYEHVPDAEQIARGQRDSLSFAAVQLYAKNDYLQQK